MIRPALWLPFAAVVALLPQAWSQSKSMDQGGHRMELILERYEGSTWKSINPALVLSPGDHVRFRFRTNFDGFLYVTNQSTSGTYDQLFPRKETGQDNHILADKYYQVPATSMAFRIAGPPGHEIVYWLVSPVRLTDIPTRPTLPSPAATTPLTLIPRCDQGILKARGDCVDTSAGPKLIPRDVDVSKELAAAKSASSELLFVREQDTAVISSRAPLTGPVIYEFQLAHR
ncbi:MAG TPA: DUF4384 domain-containing protein [Bryobacteraceae bacterium]|jgi:hypothetical protein|nr:DUF4384 domain-containing protein [Bryobacteraceae bacterium]